MSSSDPLLESAPAKVNLTLRVLRRRGDGYHELESLVVFADFGDTLRFSPGGDLALMVDGPSASAAGGGDDNLVLKAARALAVRHPGLTLGAFQLDKRLPVAAGLGGGSADAAAALRLLARANGLPADDSELYAAARGTGADVPVCLDPRARIMRGIGEVLSPALPLAPLSAVLVNPGVALPTKAVFGGLRLGSAPPPLLDERAIATVGGSEDIVRLLAAQANDLEAPAIALRPVIADVLSTLRSLAGCTLARMSGSGATCFALFAAAGDARGAEELLSARYPAWWAKAVTLCA